VTVLLKPTGSLVAVRDKNAITFDKDIPIPPAGGRARRGPYLAVQRAMERMAVETESFVSPLPMKATLSIAKSVRLATKKQFAARTLIENGETVVRVWRIE